MNLIIVESPTKARTLSRFLGSGYDVTATAGHIKDLPKSELGIDIENNFAPSYVLVAKKNDIVGEIIKRAKGADKIYLATDPDREGEAIAQHVKEILTEEQKNKRTKEKSLSSSVLKSFSIQRIAFHEITKEAVEEAIGSPRDVDVNLVDAQVARRVLDRLVGYKLSPLLWKKIRRGLSAGRVQTVTVRLIVEKEREIEAFKSEEYWEIWAQVVKSMSGMEARDEFIVQLIKVGDKKAEVKNKETADKILADLKISQYYVFDIDKHEIRKSPYPPFTTSTMTQAGARLFGWSAKKTMSVAQSLYEQGLITYHRTDSTNLSIAAVEKVRRFIGSKYGDKYLPEKPHFYKTKSKVAQEAHEAIRPTDINAKLQMTNAKWEREEEMLYQIVWKRFVSCQMSAAVYDETTIDVIAKVVKVEHVEKVEKGYLLRASGQVMEFDGWRTVYGVQNTSDGGRSSPRESDSSEVDVLPQVSKDDPLDLVKVDGVQKFTEPPARFNEASLIKTLEKLGIGRPSTYAPTINVIQVRNYVEKKEGRFYPTLVGIAVNDFLITNFPDVFEYQFTAGMEDDLDKIANGEKNWVEEIKLFWNPLASKISEVEENALRVKIETESLGIKCPDCAKEGLPADRQGDLVIRLGRFGKFISCSRFPDCKHTEKYLEKSGMKCPECLKTASGPVGDVIVKKTKKGGHFYGCSRYPKCKWASWRKPTITDEK